MDELIRILNKIKPAVDFQREDNLVESGIFDSLDIVEIMDEICKHYKIELDGDDIDPDNFGSIESIWTMIQKYLPAN